MAAAWERHDFGGDARTARAGHTATAVGKYVYVIGGRRGAYFYDDVLRYDAHKHSWEALPERLPSGARANHTATLVERGPGQREIWVVGGQNNDTVARDVWALELLGGGGQHAWRRVDVRCVRVCRAQGGRGPMGGGRRDFICVKEREREAIAV
jgi:hypothetical protein